MRTPEKSEKIYRTLKDRISSRVYRPGTQLPYEIDLAKEFSVARNTLRGGLRMLEEEGLLERIKGKGTFIANRERPTISLLMPCEDFLLHDDVSAWTMRQRFSGILRASRELFCQIATIAVSPTNKKTDIIPNCFDGLNENSRVIIPTTWFEPVFQILADRKAKICILDTQLLRKDTFPMTKSWYIVDHDLTSAFDEAVTRLYGMGARRIALVTEFIRRPGYPTITGYDNARKRFGLPDLSFCQPMTNNGNLRRIVSELYEKTHFDGLIVEIEEVNLRGKRTLNEWFGLPEEVHIITAGFYPDHYELEKKPDYFSFDLAADGYEAVRLLLGGGPPEHVMLHPDFHIEEKMTETTNMK